MNRLTQNLFSILFPFYPFWAWLFYKVTNKSIDFGVAVILIPLVFYYLLFINKRLPKYLIFFILFTIYHLISVFVNQTIHKSDSSIEYFLLTDYNVIACLYFIVIEYCIFDEKFIARMNKNILIVVVISLLVSLIQIKNPTFLFNTTIDEDLSFIGERRNFSIYSWSNLNTAGITFPILISILTSVYDTRKSVLPIIILCDIVVCFLSRARYVMISGLFVLSQLFLNTKRSIVKRVSFLVVILGGILLIAVAARTFGFDINEVINGRILEKDSDMASAKTRVLSYDVFLLVFPEHPWFGVGPETKKDVVDLLGGDAPVIHVGFLSYLYFYGIIGCGFFFLSIFYMLWDAWKVGKRQNFWGSFYGIITICLANFTLVYFNFSEMGIILSIIYLRYFSYKNSLVLEETKLDMKNTNLVTGTSFYLEKVI